MTPKDDKPSDDTMRAQDAGIRERAYEIWVSEGRPEGRHSAHWEQARSELEGRAGAATSPSTAASASPKSRGGKAAAPGKSKTSTPARPQAKRPSDPVSPTNGSGREQS